MTFTTAGRLIAVAVSLPTFATLFLDGGFRSDNLFLVPDLVLCALLLIGAALPERHAVPVLTFAFGLAAGVITTAVFSYVSRGAADEGILTIAGALTCVVMAWLFARRAGNATP